MYYDNVMDTGYEGPAARPTAGELRRAEFIDSGMRCIQRLGIRKCTMDDFAAEAGVSRVTLYREFGTREELIEAITVHRFTTFNKNFAAKSRKFSDLESALEAYFMATVRLVLKNPVTQQMIIGKLDFAKPGMPLHRLCAELWMPAFNKAKQAGRLAEDIDLAEATRWVLVTQFMLCKLALEADMKAEQLAAFIRAFITPAFGVMTPRRR